MAADDPGILDLLRSFERPNDDDRAERDGRHAPLDERADGRGPRLAARRRPDRPRA